MAWYISNRLLYFQWKKNIAPPWKNIIVVLHGSNYPSYSCLVSLDTQNVWTGRLLITRLVSLVPCLHGTTNPRLRVVFFFAGGCWSCVLLPLIFCGLRDLPKRFTVHFITRYGRTTIPRSGHSNDSISGSNYSTRINPEGQWLWLLYRWYTYERIEIL